QRAARLPPLVAAPEPRLRSSPTAGGERDVTRGRPAGPVPDRARSGTRPAGRSRRQLYIAAPRSRNAPDGEPGGTMGSGAQQLPVPGTPPDAVHASADGRNEHDVSVQSASAAQD